MGKKTYLGESTIEHPMKYFSPEESKYVLYDLIQELKDEIKELKK